MPDLHVPGTMEEDKDAFMRVVVIYEVRLVATRAPAVAPHEGRGLDLRQSVSGPSR
jgi:hypothetical protein